MQNAEYRMQNKCSPILHSIFCILHFLWNLNFRLDRSAVSDLNARSRFAGQFGELSHCFRIDFRSQLAKNLLAFQRRRIMLPPLVQNPSVARFT
jgi:hypothetical protein